MDDAPHYWVRGRGTADNKTFDMQIEFRHHNVPVFVLDNYEFKQVLVRDIRCGDIINARYKPMHSKEFFALVTSIEKDKYSGTVTMRIDIIDSKLKPQSE